MMAKTPELEPYELDADNYDRNVLGFPFWAGNVTPQIRTFIKDNDFKGNRLQPLPVRAEQVQRKHSAN